MPTDAGSTDIVSHGTGERAASPADRARRTGNVPRERRVRSSIGPGVSEPMVEVELTRVRSRPTAPVVSRLDVAWLLSGAFGLTSLLSSTVKDQRTGELLVSSLILPMFLLTVGTLVWAAIETHCATRRQSAGSARQPTGHVSRPPDDTTRPQRSHVP
jgi:hypothetical protein